MRTDLVNSRIEKKIPAKTTQRAIVIGGSLAGMLAARVLLDHYDEVTIIESDRYPGRAGSRSGIPQAKHVHVLMLRGQEILEQLFPGIRASLVAADAQLIDMAGDARWLTPAGWGVRFPSPLIMLACTRDLLDWLHAAESSGSLSPFCALASRHARGRMATVIPKPCRERALRNGQRRSVVCRPIVVSRTEPRALSHAPQPSPCVIERSGGTQHSGGAS